MGSSHSTHTGAQGDLGHRASQWAASANQGALQFAAGLHTAAETTAALHQGATHLAQAAGPAVDTLRLAMAHVQQARHGGAYGGDGDYYGGARRGFFGGDDGADPAKGLREYEASLSAQAKEDVIRRLARALKRAGIAVDPEGDLGEIVRGLVAQLPNPRTNKQSFSAEAQAQEKICRLIADVLNDEFTPGETAPSAKFVDTSLSAVEICRAVGEWAHGFAAGVNTEFLAVHASVRAALRNIEILAEVMREVYAKIRQKAERLGDAEFGREFDPLNEIFSRAQAERQRQEELLKNILNVHLAPAAKELEIAMQDESEQNALIKRLGLKPGTSEFADSLAMAVSGLGTSASIAQRVHRALKQVGFSVRQYLESPGYAEFQRLLDAKVESGSIGAEDLAKFLEAANTLRLNFDDRQDARFREALEVAGATGGAEDEYRTAVDKRVERAKTEKSVIVRDFVGRVARHYDELLAAVKALSLELGKKIPLTDKTDALRDALTRLRDMREARIELALVGLYADAAARERKERFLSGLRLVSGTCAMLMELEMYRPAASLFARLKAAIDALEKTIDYFADVISKKFGGEDGDGDGDAGLDLYDEGAYGGARRREGHARGGAGDEDLLPEIARSALSLTEAVNEFAYFYYVAKVRVNLEQSAAELEIFGEKYVELLGDAVAARLWNLRQARRAIDARLTEANRAAGPPAGPLHAVFGATGTAAVPNASGDARFAATKKWVDREHAAKENFYKAVQAMDLYMKAFTAGIVKDPDAVCDIKKMLDGTQVIARWFSEDTGNHLWRAFEHMWSVDFAALTRSAGGGARAAAQAVLNDADGARPHYYQKVANTLGANGTTLGVPQAGIPAGDDPAQPDHADLAKKSVASAIDHYQALKNLVNAFARIGDRFGGRELRTQVFMSPTQIFKALTDYMKQSAMSINAGDAAEPRPLDTPIHVTGSLAAGGNVVGGVGRYQVYFGSALAGLAGNYEVEDRYFVMIVKAMAAKILTALGVYDMFERRTPKYDLTPTRLIVGGADDGEPEVVEGAAELYFRLPRLAEFYRHFLRWDGRGQQLKIAMLPELEGIFSGLIRLVFQKIASPQSGDYSDYELNALVREINQIYRHYHEKSGERAAQAALSGFVMEINRRYGVIKSEDMTKYWEFVRRARRAGEWGSFNDTNYAILPGEEEIEVDRRAPSDRYTLLGEPAARDAAALPREFAGRVLLDDDANAAGARRMLLRGFRADLEKEFAEARDGFGTVSYSLLIKQAEIEIRRAASKEAQLAVAHKLIQSTSVLGPDANKALMFHETVVVGLNTVGAIHAYLDAFSRQVDLLNAATITNAIMDGLHAGLGIDTPAANFNQAALVGAGYMNTGRYTRYIFTGTANNLGGADSLRLWTRGGINADVRTGHVYQFWVLEGAFARGNGGQLPDLPSTYTGQPAAVAALGANQQRCLRAMRLFARLVVHYQLLMRDYVETLFALGSSGGGLVEVRFPQGDATQVQVNFSKLRGVAEAVLADVKYYLDFFRPFIPPATIHRFEDRGADGSVFWLEERLVDVRFRGVSDDPSDPSARETLDGLSRRANDAYLAMVGDTDVVLGATINAGAANSLIDANNAQRAAASILVPAGANADTRYENYGMALSALLWYDAGVPNSGLAVPAVVAGGWDAQYTLGGLIATARAQGNRAATPPAAAGGAPGRFLFYLDAGATTQYRSLYFAFNQLLARYLAVFTDPSGTRKIYVSLVDAFANGVASRAVTTPQGQAFPDIAAGAQNFGRRGDPGNGVILFQSLAFVLQRLVKDANPATQVADHLVSTLTDVPLYVKESYRANLPGFVRLFDLIVQKGDFIKQLYQKTSIRCGRPDLQTIAGAAGGTKIRTNADLDDTTNLYPAGSLVALRPLDGALDSDAMKVRASEIIDALSTGAYTLSSRATDVLRELGDQPVYLQTQEGSIETYKARYGKLPLMPFSLALHFYGDLAAGSAATDSIGFADDLKLFPSGSYGEPRFKVQYGVRGLLVRQTPVEYDALPGVRALVEAYNGVSARREQLDAGRYLEFVKNATVALRYFAEARNYKSAISTLGALFSAQPVYAAVGGAAGFAVRLWDGAAGNSAYPLGKDAQAIVTAVESSNQDEEMRKITAVVGQGPAGATGADKRAKERILNLVDMNIIPINVHALMRDIPLANLYNYEYTFEQMAAALYGEAANSYLEGSAEYVADAKIRQSRQMFLRLLVNPYYNLDQNHLGEQLYGSDVLDLGSAGFVHRIFRGDSNLGLGRPKFLSDQLFNKALFGSTYLGAADYDEAGPGVGAGIARGRAGVGLRDQDAVRQRLINAYRTLDGLLQFLLATATAAAVAVGAFDDGAGGDAAADAALIAAGAAAPMGRAATAINAALADYAAALAIVHPHRANSPALGALDAELTAQVAPAAGDNGVVVGTNLRGVLLDVAAGAGGAGARGRMVLDALRGATQGAGPVLTVARVARQAAMFTGIAGNAARTVDIAVQDALAQGLIPGTRLPAQRVEWVPARGRRATHISFLQAPAADARPETAVVELDVGATKAVLECIGRMRFDTRLVRNVFFITNVLRLVRLKLNRELTQSRSVLTSSHSAVAPGLTEYGTDPFGPNEVYGSTLPNGYARFDDGDQLP